MCIYVCSLKVKLKGGIGNFLTRDLETKTLKHVFDNIDCGYFDEYEKSKLCKLYSWKSHSFHRLDNTHE